MKQIDLFINTKSQFGVLASQDRSLHEAFLRAGIKSKIYDLLKESPESIASKLAKEKPDCTVGFNVVFSSDLFYDQLKVPHVSLFVDSASFHKEIMECPKVVPCYAEEDSCFFIESLGMHKPLFFPHAIDQKYLADIPETKRDLDVVMTGSFYDPENIPTRWKAVFSEKLVKLLHKIAEDVLASDSRSVLQVFVENIQEQNPFGQEIQQKGFQLFDVSNSVDQYIRGIDRVRMLQALEGLDLHIYGPKEEHTLWKKALPTKNRLFFHEEVAFDKLPELFKRSRVVINSAPTIKHGLHERLLLALSQGASVLTSDNEYLAVQFPERNAVMRILSPNYAQANELIRVSDVDRLADIERAVKTIKRAHTWDVRVSLLQKELPSRFTELKARD